MGKEKSEAEGRDAEKIGKEKIGKREMEFIYRGLLLSFRRLTALD